MTLAELLESRFRGDIRFRGAAYVKAERVAITRVTADHIFAVVRDPVEHQTQLTRNGGELKMYCSCPDGSKPDGACRHLWATILAVDEAECIPGSIKPGFIPPFAVEPGPPVFDESWGDDDDADGDVFYPPTGGAVSRPRAAIQVEPRLSPWQLKLRDLRRDIESRQPAAPSAGREREIFYEIDIEQSRSVQQLVIQTSQRQRRSNGAWGKLKPLKLRPGKLEEIEHEDDSRILAYLFGGTAERTNWYAQQNEVQSTVFRYRIPYELCELILPLMCETGRVRFLDEPNRPPLQWDEGEPWELAIRVDEDAEEQTWKLAGELRRGDATLALNQARLLVRGGLVCTETHIARLRDFDSFDWTILLKDGFEVPAGEEQSLIDTLFDMPSLPRLELPPELDLEEVRAEPVPHLLIRSPRGTRRYMERLQAEVHFGYLGTLVSGDTGRWAIVQREEGRCLVRDRGAEERAWAQLHEVGFRRLLDRRRNRHDVEIAPRELGPAVRNLVAAGWEVRADGKQVHQPGQLQFRIKSNIDWFELHADVDFGGLHVPFPELLSALARGDTTVRLSDGSLGILPEEWVKQFGLLAGLGVADEDHVRFAPNQVALLDALLAAQPSVDYDAEFDRVRQRFSSFSGITPAEEPKEFHGALRGYQREGLGWLNFLEEFRIGGCLADDMGLGKTVQVIALLLERKKLGLEAAPSLVVVPKSLMFNWHQECTRFAPDLNVLEYSGLQRAALRKQFKKQDIVLTTYGTLRRDVMHLKDTAFDYVVLDEAQAIKNSGSQVAKAVRLLSARHRLALSGTPIENHLGDLWSIFEFLNPGMLGRSSIIKNFASNGDNDRNRELLSHALRPFILRRTKRQVAAELPDKLEQTIYCDMRREQKRLYEELRDHYRSSLLGMVSEQGLARTKMHVLEALLRLRQAACHPGLLNETARQEPSAKLDVLVPHLEELIEEGHKALVFSQFTSMLAIVRERLDERGVVYEYLDGQTRNRKQRVERFQGDPNCGAFLISLKAGGLGLNLTAADYVFLLDPWWNPAVEAQAIDRAHRVGQTRQVFAYRLICRGTVEEKIAELQNQKRDLADSILQADSSVLRDLSTEDLEMLLS